MNKGDTRTTDFCLTRKRTKESVRERERVTERERERNRERKSMIVGRVLVTNPDVCRSLFKHME